MIKSFKKTNFIQILLILSQCHDSNIIINRLREMYSLHSVKLGIYFNNFISKNKNE